jgi:hypothetical protein
MIVLGLGALVVAILILLTGARWPAWSPPCWPPSRFPMLIVILFWLDRYEPEPDPLPTGGPRLGRRGRGGLSFIAEQVLFAGCRARPRFIDTAVTARPSSRRPARVFSWSWCVVFRRAQVHGLLDGLIYGALVGGGLRVRRETLLYYLSSLQDGALPVTFFLRGVMGPFAHPLFTAATGIGSRHRGDHAPAGGARRLAPISGFYLRRRAHARASGTAAPSGAATGSCSRTARSSLPLLAIVLAVGIWAGRGAGKDAERRIAADRGDGLDPAGGRCRWVSPTLGPDVGSGVSPNGMAARRQRGRCGSISRRSPRSPSCTSARSTERLRETSTSG